MHKLSETKYEQCDKDAKFKCLSSKPKYGKLHHKSRMSKAFQNCLLLSMFNYKHKVGYTQY